MAWIVKSAGTLDCPLWLDRGVSRLGDWCGSLSFPSERHRNDASVVDV